MKKLQLLPVYWPSYILFLFICSYIIGSWTTTDINAVTSALNAINFTTKILISFIIGTHIAQLSSQQLKPIMLLWMGSVYLLLQLIYYPTHTLIDSSSWMLWLVPLDAGQFAASALIALSVLLLFKNLHGRNRLVALAFITFACVIAFQQYLFPMIYLSLGIMAGYVIYVGKITHFHSKIALNANGIPWFYVNLALTPLVANWAPSFSSDTSLTVKYLFCILASTCIIFISASKPGVSIFYWFTGWIDWISGHQKTEHQTSQQPIYLYSVANKSYPQWVTYSLISIFHAAFLLSLALFIIELPVREWSFNSVINWVNDSAFFVAITCTLLFILYCILRILLSRLTSSLLLLGVVALLSSTNVLKILYLGVPLVPSDLHLIDQALDSLIFIAGKAWAIIIYLSIFFLLVIFAFIVRRYAKRLLNTNPWIGLRGLAAFFVLFFLLLQPEKLALSNRLPNAWDIGNGTGLYTYAGFATGFLYRYQQFYIRAPENFSAESTLRLASSLNLQSKMPAANQTRKPHIIIIQSEAFWDPGNLQKDLYPRGSPGNLLPLCNARLHNNTSYCQAGYVEVPTFGGSTANSEFEFLTGLSMQLLPPGTTPFVHYIQKPTPSLGWRAKQANYQTLAIHPNGGWFWNRDKVYPLLGIEEFLDIGTFDNLPRNQLYVTDHAINQLITARIDQATKPQFIFAVTMANHAPFTDQRYNTLDNEPIDWEQLPVLSAEEQQAIKTYSIGVRESRLALEELIGTYNKKDAPPVIIVFYGDHLPILGEDFSIYHKTHFKTESIRARYKEFYSTPYLVWSNQNLSRPLATSMTVSLLGQEVMNLAGLGNSGLQQLITQLQDSSLLRRPTRTQVLNNEPRAPLSEQQKVLAQLYKHASFDALFHQTALSFFGLEQPLDLSALAVSDK